MATEKLIIIPEKDPELRRGAAKRGAASILPGLGQFLNGQYIKAAISFAAFLVFLALFFTWIAPRLEGFITLGTNEGYDNSLFMMIYGLIALVVLSAFILLYIYNIQDAYKTYVWQRLPSYEKLSRKEELARFLNRQSPLLFMLPGLIAVAGFVLLPLLFSISIAFTNYNSNNMPPGTLLKWVGFKNFNTIFSDPIYKNAVPQMLGWTLVWVILSTLFPFAIGIALALLMNREKLPLKKFFKIIYILPWAIPGFISVKMLQTFFLESGGIINLILSDAGRDPIKWQFEVFPARASVIIVATWLSFSFPMMLSDSIIGAIPKELYEAAKLDGATSMRQFLHITMPLLMFSIAPIFIMSLSGAFNNFNVIYLLTAGGPDNFNELQLGKTDIIISWIYKMTRSVQQYDIVAAISIILFILLAAFSIFNLRRTRNFKEEDILT